MIQQKLNLHDEEVKALGGHSQSFWDWLSSFSGKQSILFDLAFKKLILNASSSSSFTTCPINFLEITLILLLCILLLDRASISNSDTIQLPTDMAWNRSVSITDRFSVSTSAFRVDVRSSCKWISSSAFSAWPALWMFDFQNLNIWNRFARLNLDSFCFFLLGSIHSFPNRFCQLCFSGF